MADVRCAFTVNRFRDVIHTVQSCLRYSTRRRLQHFEIGALLVDKRQDQTDR